MASLRTLHVLPRYVGNTDNIIPLLTRLADSGHPAQVNLCLTTFPQFFPLIRLFSTGSFQNLRIVITGPAETGQDLKEATLKTIRAALESLHDEDVELFASLLRSKVPVGFDFIPNFHQDSRVCELVISDDNGDTIAMDVLTIGVGEFRFNLDWSWGDPQPTARTRAAVSLDAWNRSERSGLTSSEFLQQVLALLDALRPALIPDADKLFPHQRRAIEAWVKNDFRGVFEMCTGAGKTIAAIAGLKTLQSELSKSGEHLGIAVVICPTQVLVEQWEQEIVNAGLERPLLAYDYVQNYVARLGIFLDQHRHTGLRIVITTDVTFGSGPFVNEIRKATESGTKALLIADEMHNYASVGMRQIFRSSSKYFKYRLGLSATPEIEGDDAANKFIEEYFGQVVGKYSLKQAIADGVLCRYKYYPKPVFLDDATSASYLDTLRQLGKEENRSNANLYRQRNDLIRRSGVQIPALAEIVDAVTPNDISHTLVFCPPGRDSSEEEERLLHRAKRIFEERGILTTSIVAGTPPKERPGILKSFADGEFKVLLAIGCLDEGMNVPAITRAIMLYSLDRRRQFIQRRGRILRRSPGKEFAVINDIVILPHNSDMPESEAQSLLQKELRRYSEFASMAENREEAESILKHALEVATKQEPLCSKS